MRRSDRQLREIAYLWSIGRLAYLLHEGQVELRNLFYAHKARRVVLNCSRRYGKSVFLCALAIECALTTQKARIRYAAPTKEALEDFIEPIMEMLLEECPKHLRPVYNVSSKRWTFPSTGAVIAMAGCENRKYANRLRGRECHLAIVDEAGDVMVLEFLVERVLMPQLITAAGGKEAFGSGGAPRGFDGRIIIASTPPTDDPVRQMAFKRYCDQAKLLGAYVERTLYDAPHISRAIADEFIEEAGGRDSDAARSEYFCEFVISQDIAVVPEFAKNRQHIVRSVPMPDYFIPYVLADGGFHDQWATGFYVWDFKAARFIQVAELVEQRKNSGEIIPKIRAIEMELWGRDANPRRYGDFTELERADIAGVHGMSFAPVIKVGKHEAVNLFRVDCSQGHVIIDPSCERTIQQLESCVWNRSKTDFERPGGIYGHFDAAAQIIYAARVIDRQENPYPTLVEGVRLPGISLPRNVIENERLRKLRTAFGGASHEH